MAKRAFPERLELYNAGLTDTDIANRLGLKSNTVTVWRRSENLRPNAPHKRGRVHSRMMLYELGWSDHHIAKEQGVSKHSVLAWRRTRGLRPNFPLGANERYDPRPALASLMVQVRRAVGRSLASDIADDVVSEMVLALLEDAVPLQRVGIEARRFGNKVIAQFANKFGPRSLDEQLGGDEGCSLMECVRDGSSTDWLEEMGATVW